jgi:general secretion pathway protein D
MSPQYLTASVLGCVSLLLAGCPKGGQEFKVGRQAELAQDWDTAVVSYERALKNDPRNTEYKLKIARARFEAGQYHVRQGQMLRDKGQIEVALAEFQKALAIDPSSSIADQEVRRTLEMLAAKNVAAGGGPSAPQPEVKPKLQENPPELMPISTAAINLKMTNDAKIVYETIGKLAGIAVIFDPDFPARRIGVELNNVTLSQALDVVALQTKSFWKPVTTNIIMVAPDNAQKRKDYEEQVVRTFYLGNTLLPQDLTEIVTGLRQLLDLHRVQQVNSLNAIMIRDTPDKIALAEKLIRDIDKAKPEVDLHVAVLQVRRDRLRNLGIQPGTSVTLSPTPQKSSSSPTTTGTTTTTTSNTVTLRDLAHLTTKDYSLSLPGATATALYTDSTTKVIQDPEIRMLDGQPAILRIGDRVPIATGSFGSGLGGVVGGGTTGGAIINPLVQTQFQYIDVGVNLNITPHIHPNGEISLKVMVEVSSVTGHVSIGGIDQPIISQRHVENDVRLREGEANILGGMIDRSQTKSISGWPGVAKIPILRYLFSSENVEEAEQEILIVMTPRLVRMPSITAENLRSVSSGTDTNFQVHREGELQAPPVPPPVQQPPAPQPGAGATPPAAGTQAARLHFEPPIATLKPGETTTISVAIDNVQDLFSIPMLLQYNPAVISIEEVRHGGFLSGGTQEIAIVQRVDKERGQAIISATRQPNTPGVNGTGTLLGIVIKAVGTGSSTISILQVNARDSQQKPIQLVTSEAAIRVQ